MIISGLNYYFLFVFFLLSNDLNSRRDRSILYTRITNLILIYSIILSKIALYASFLDKGIGLYGGLLHCTAVTLKFHLFIFFLIYFRHCFAINILLP